MRSLKLLAVALLTVMAVKSVIAAPTEASILTCSPATVTPGNNVTCTIRARDGLQEPTTIDTTDSFMIRVTADTQGSIPQVSPITITVDPTVATFSVGASAGTRLVIDVTASNGRPLRGSGFEALIYSWPPVFLGKLSCDKSTLTLRDATTCTVPAIGSNGIPALVTPSDVFLSEDHGDGTFAMISGTGSFVFTFTAPNYPSMNYPAFVLRIVLTGAVGDPRNVSLPVQFPVLTPTVRTTLRCTDSDFAMCVVNAANDGGPVMFNSNDYLVSFEQDTSGLVNAPSWAASNAMTTTWSAASSVQMASIGNLKADQYARNNVFLCRMHVRLASTGQEVDGSPHIFTSGIAPTAADLSIQKCTRSFIVAGGSTTCYIAVGPTVSAAPRYVSVAVSSGYGTLTSVEYVNGSFTSIAALQNQRALRFNYTAPKTIDGDRLDVSIAAAVQGQNIVNSPTRIVVFPKTSTTPGTTTTNRRPVIALGLCFFGASFTIGFIAFYRRQSRIQLIKRHRREKEMMEAEMENKLKVHSRPLSPLEKKEIKAQLSAFAKEAAADERRP